MNDIPTYDENTVEQDDRLPEPEVPSLGEILRENSLRTDSVHADSPQKADEQEPSREDQPDEPHA